jgi:FeS assembly protein IscX
VSAKLKWSDTEEIGIRLHEKFPDVDPLSVRFTDLLRWISELEDFGDDPKAANEKKLEAVQMAWYEEFQGK